ncbi:MAG: hypothetical protein MPN21_06395 [Thermoanaerobaculia bacterium]|nr:hypothetical protein [Thermoanaerobaculia bacterium]
MTTISTRDLSALPDLEGTRNVMRALAMLDAVLCPEWEFRYFSFNDDWEPGEKLGLMRNGEGDDWLLFFNPQGAILKGFQHDASMARKMPWPGLFDGVPGAFEKFLSEPAFTREQTTFCAWLLDDDRRWRRSETIEFPMGDDPDGSAKLMQFLDGQPDTYKAWADEYYGVPVDLRVVERVYRQEPLRLSLIRALNPDAHPEIVYEEARDIGYPLR